MYDLDTQVMRKKSYDARFKHPSWFVLRKKMLQRAGNQCEFVDHSTGVPTRCQARKSYQCILHVHHLTYRRFGHERDEDLQVLCTRHHAAVELMKVKRGCRNAPFFANVVDAVRYWDKYVNAYKRKTWSQVLGIAKKAVKSGCVACKHNKGNKS